MRTNRSFPSRRAFLSSVASAAAVPLVLPRTVLGAEERPAPSNRITMGLIGCGGQSRGLLENAINHPQTQFVAVCDVDELHGKEKQRLVNEYYENEDCALYADYRELLARGDIDAVIIATPDHWHAAICIEAASKGCDIYCEKPLTWSLGEGQAVVEAVRKNHVVFQTGSMQRSEPRFKFACQLVLNGHIGEVQRILVSLPDNNNAAWVDAFPEPPRHLDWKAYVGPAEWAPYHPNRSHWDWRWWMGFAGGQMMDWIGHHGDIAQMGMGWDNTGPRKVVGLRWEATTQRNNLYDAPARYMFRCEYDGGVEMLVANQSDMPEEFEGKGSLGTMFIGSEGRWVYVDRGTMETSHEDLKRNPFEEGDFRFRRERNHMTDFLTCIETREECIAPVNAGHRSASIGHLGKLACQLGTSFTWDPEKEEITDNPALNRLLQNPRFQAWKAEA